MARLKDRVVAEPPLWGWPLLGCDFVALVLDVPQWVRRRPHSLSRSKIISAKVPIIYRRLSVSDVLIRSYHKEDRPSIREISFETAFMGRPADVFFTDQEILADTLTAYFTDHEPGSCFVAEADASIVGYLIGAKNKRALGRIFLFNILPRLFFKALLCGTFLNSKNRAFVFYCLKSYFKGEFQMPDFSKDYPATLHINIRQGFRGQGVGAKLMGVYLQYLTLQKVKGVHMSTMSNEATVFFQSQGFEVLCQRSQSYFRTLLGEDIVVTTLGKRIS